jgi:hypothetical protein
MKQIKYFKVVKTAGLTEIKAWRNKNLKPC